MTGNGHENRGAYGNGNEPGKDVPDGGKSGKNDGKPGSSWMTWGAAALAVLTKYKAIVPLLSKLVVPTFSMLASAFAYAWATRSWTVGIGFVAMLLIHEIGHVLAARQKGLPVSAPVFIPFVGALITMRKHPRDAATEAWIAIGGPLLGSLGALLALLAGMALSSTDLILVAYLGFFVNLFNLLPIRPLDGGRIAAAVTRWLWAVGLVAGLVLIVYLRSILLLMIYALFAYELYRKYVSGRAKKAQVVPFAISIPEEHVRAMNVFVPGEHHHRKLDFATWTELDGTQRVEVIWDALAVRETLNLQEPFLVEEVRVTGIRHVHNEQGDVVRYDARCEMVGIPHENDRYHDIPVRVRWAFGAAYFGLAGVLAALMAAVQHMHLPGIGG